MTFYGVENTVIVFSRQDSICHLVKHYRPFKIIPLGGYAHISETIADLMLQAYSGPHRFNLCNKLQKWLAGKNASV